jgi:hypothetical protein
MAVDHDFPEVRRRIHSLEAQISDIERVLSLATPDAETQAAIYRTEQANRELQQIDFLLRYYQRQNNGKLSKMQTGLFVVSVMVSILMLILLLVERLI